MIKYYDELENRDNYFLPLIEQNIDNRHIVWDFKLPISFYHKHRDTLKYYNEILSDYKFIDENLVHNMEKLGILSFDEWYNVISELESINYESHSSFNEINYSGHDLYYDLDYICKILLVLSIVIKEKSEYYLKLSNIFKSMQKEIENYKYIKIKKSNIRNVYLPDAWYITPFNDLYNTGGVNGHKETNLVYCQDRVEEKIDCSIKISDEYNFLFELRKSIIQKRCINKTEFINFLNYKYTFVSLDENKDYFERTTHDIKIFNAVKGVLSAQTAFYKFFSDLQEYTENPKNEIIKLEELTKNDIGDVLVRCCGFHKVESMVNKTITTSLVNYETEFDEYIKRGWRIDFLPPIIIQRDLGIISELDMESLFVKKYVNKL